MTKIEKNRLTNPEILGKIGDNIMFMTYIQRQIKIIEMVLAITKKIKESHEQRHSDNYKKYNLCSRQKNTWKPNRK